MKMTAWIISEIPFFVMLSFIAMNLCVEVGANRTDLLAANVPIITLLIIYLVFRRWDV